MPRALDGKLSDGSCVTIRWDGNQLTGVEPIEPRPDLPWLLPGLIDLQVNGYGGFDVNGADATVADVHGMRERLAAEGTTQFVPTVITESHELIRASLESIRAACAEDPRTAAAIPWAHLEGPFISDQDGPRGAHALEWIREPSLAELDDWQEASGGMVGMVTISPHHPGSIEFIRGAVERGVRVSVGHSHASADEVSAAIDAGAAYSTHLGNGIYATLPRHPNIIWAQLARDELVAGMIADGHHLPLDALRAMIKSKGLERSFIVSDSVALAGGEPGRYQAPVGGEVELHADGRLNVAGTPYLAGAALSLRWGIPTLLRAGFSLPEVEQLVSVNAGRIAGQDVALRVGNRADIVAFRASGDEWQVERVVASGEVVV